MGKVTEHPACLDRTSGRRVLFAQSLFPFWTKKHTPNLNLVNVGKFCRMLSYFSLFGDFVPGFVLDSIGFGIFVPDVRYNFAFSKRIRYREYGIFSTIHGTFLPDVRHV